MLGGLDYKGIGVRVKAWLQALANIPLAKGDLWTSDGIINQRFAVGADGKALVADSSQPTGLNYALLSHGQCQLSKSGANLLLSPFNGNKIIINSTMQAVPDAGVTLAPPAVASTAYYIYAFMNAGVMTLENVATAPAVQAGTGVKIKTGDATRTLVGQARTTAGNAWADSATQRFVRSWFNDGGFAAQNTFSADRSTASATYVELNSEIRTEFLAWSGETITCAADGSWVQTAGGGAGSTGIGFDGAALDPTFETLGFSEVAAHPEGFTLAGAKSTLAEGYHFATLLGRTNGNTGTWSSASATNAAKNYLHVSSNGH